MEITSNPRPIKELLVFFKQVAFIGGGEVPQYVVYAY
jgi:hypothetical protein